MALKLSNNATSLLASSISDGVTTIAITSGDEGKFPTLGGGDWCPLVVVDGSGNLEIMKCTARSGVTLTVERGKEGTSAHAFDAGARVDVRLTLAAVAAMLDRSEHTGSQAQSTITGLVAALAALTAADLTFATKNNAVFTGTTTLAQDPASGLQAATKQYVDALAVNVGRRERVRVATTANITIATALNAGDVVDGVTLADGDPVLVKDQSAPAENGIYVVGASPARFSEYDTYDEHAGSLIAVQEGTANADTFWLCTSNKGGTLGSTAINFSKQFQTLAQAVWEAGVSTTEALVSPAKIEEQIKERCYGPEVVTTQVISGNPTSVNFTGLGAYQRLKLIFHGVTLNTNAIPTLRVSTNGGSSYLTTGYAANSRVLGSGGGNLDITSAVPLTPANDTGVDRAVIDVDMFNTNAKAFFHGTNFGALLTAGFGPSGVNDALRLTTTGGTAQFTGGTVTVLGWRSRP